MAVSHPAIPSGAIELLRRLLALLLFIAAATSGFGYGRIDLALLAAAAGLLLYVLVPRPVVPPGAVHHQRLPAVYLPDLVGFMLATVFFALPLVVSAQAPWLDGPWGLYLMTGLPGLVVLAVFYFSSRNQCLWLRAADKRLTVSGLWGVEVLDYAAIAEIRGETRSPPRWLAPLLTLFGGWRGLGIALATDRPTHTIVLERHDGTRLRLPADAFADLRKIVAILGRGGVRLDAGLTHWLGHSAPHPRLRHKTEPHAGRAGHDAS